MSRLMLLVFSFMKLTQLLVFPSVAELKVELPDLTNFSFP